MHRTDEELVAAYLDAGDEGAFRVLVERHQERVFGYLVGMVRDRSVASDLFQETYIRVIRALSKDRGSYTRQGKWINWVMRIARNAALDHIRSRKKWTDVTPSDDDSADYWEQLPGQDLSADEMMHLAQQQEWLYACIEKLPEEQREVLLLRHESELTFREIAELTDCSINTALGRMRYALLNLRKMMEESREENLADYSTST
ncbi:MAG: sigma-70 family RNA polymerase sigma factor [Bacteroidetes bacterium]|nr:sigma-70 family RNA polymerase sigma factor [Bacteroidota bacterium]